MARTDPRELDPEPRNRLDALTETRQSPGVPRNDQVPRSKLSPLIPKGAVLTGNPKREPVKR